jgi:hypothetical protein
MAQYVEQPNRQFGIDAQANSMMLKVDLHKSLDGLEWAAVPNGRVWVAHFFRGTNLLGYFFHNRQLSVNGLASQLLFARFAMVVFGHLVDFIAHYKDKGVPVQIAIEVNPDQPIAATLSGSIAAKVLPLSWRGTPSSTSQAGKKRSRTPQNNVNQDILSDGSFDSSTLVAKSFSGNDDDGFTTDASL